MGTFKKFQKNHASMASRLPNMGTLPLSLLLWCWMAQLWPWLEFFRIFFYIWFRRSLALHDINIEAPTQLLADYISWPHTSSIHLENLKRPIFKAIKIKHFETFQSKTLLLPPIVPIQKALNLFRFHQQVVWLRFQSLWLIRNFKYFLRDSVQKSGFCQAVYHRPRHGGGFFGQYVL